MHLKACLLLFLTLVLFVSWIHASGLENQSQNKGGLRRLRKQERKLFQRFRRRFHRDFDLKSADLFRGPGSRKTHKSLRRILDEYTRKGFRQNIPPPPPPSEPQQASRKSQAKPSLIPDGYDRTKKRPNIILIMTDDQDVELGSLQFMPKLNRFLREEGAYFEHGYVTTPMCCPSRSSMLTGLYVHNHQVLTNNDNCSSTEWVEKHEPRSFAAYLQQAGYKTAYFGKYLNKYNGNRIPVGWDEWAGLVRNSRFYNYTINRNGEKVRYGFDYAKDYYPDLITNDSLSFFKSAKNRAPDQPVMMVMSFPGPHGPEDSAPQYSDLFFNVTTHHTPAYDYAPNPDKQWILQVTDRMEPIHRKFTDVLMTKRLQTLQSIDEAIARLHGTLKDIEELENTYIVYTSDHGYHLGQFGLVKGKSFPFEMDIKVPFFVRGPGFEAGSTLGQPVLNIDLAPTFLDMAGLPKPPHMDGKSILDVINSNLVGKWRDSFLVERGKMTTIRFDKMHNVKSNEGLPLGDLDTDQGKTILAKKRLNKQARLAIECLKPKFQDPCLPHQKHKCVAKRNGGWKFKKCRPSIDPRRRFPPIKLPACHCIPGDEFGWRKPLGESESEFQARIDQWYGPHDSDNETELWKVDRNLLRRHQGSGGNNRRERKLIKQQQKFLASFAGWKDRPRRKGGRRHHERWRRDLDFEEAETNDTSTEMFVADSTTTTTTTTSSPMVPVTFASPDLSSIVVVEEEAPLEMVLDEIAQDEIQEVDIIMEDISDEIKDLQQSINVSESSSASNSPVELQCRVMDDHEVNCSTKVFESPDTWRTSRALINEQIRRLRAQLNELKEIRKHLKNTRPYQDFEFDYDDLSFSESGQLWPTPNFQDADEEDAWDLEVDGDDEDDLSYLPERIPNNAVQCRCNETAQERLQSFNRAQREQIKLERLRKRMRRREQRQRIKARKSRRESRKSKVKNCVTGQEDSSLNCFAHDNDHWRTAPFWTSGKFCACTNSNTNTYWCVRTVNATHNYLYCEFVSGTITYYDLNIDPYQLRNIYQTLSDQELNYMHKQLRVHMSYSGYDDFEGGQRMRRRLEGKPKGHKKHKNVFSKRYGRYLPSVKAYHRRRRGRNRKHRRRLSSF